MKRLSLIAVAASLLINASGLGVIASGIEESSLPHGQVIVTDLGNPSLAVAYAQVNSDTASRGAVTL